MMISYSDPQIDGQDWVDVLFHLFGDDYIVHSGSQWLIMVKNGEWWFIMTKNGEKWSIMFKNGW